MLGLLPDYWLSAMENLSAHRLRSVLTMLGVIIGVAMVIVLVSLGEACKEYIKYQVGGMGFGGNALVIHPGKMDPPIEPSKLTLADCRELSRRIPILVDQVPILVGSANVRVGREEIKTSVWGLTENYPTLVNYRVADGRFFSAPDVEQHRKVCVVGQVVKSKLFAGMDPVGETVRINGRRFTVLGVMEPKGEMLGINMDDVAIMPITSAQDLLDTNRLNEIVVWAQDVGSLHLARERITAYLSSRHLAGDDFHFHTQEEMLSILGSVTGVLTMVVTALASVSLVVGAVGITNIMLVSVVERTREIGVRKALGARSRDIFWQFFMEALVVSVAGGGLGILVGIIVSAMAMNAMHIPIVVSRWAIVMAVINSGAVGVVAGVFPALRAAKADPIKALRHE